MKNVAKILGVKLNEEFIVIHEEGRSTVKLTSDGLIFVNHLGQLKTDASSICLKEILNGNYKIERMGKILAKEDISKYIKNNKERITKYVEVNGRKSPYEEYVLRVEDLEKWLEEYQ